VHNVQVIGHDGERINTPGSADRGSPKAFLEPIAVSVIAYDILTADVASCEVLGLLLHQKFFDC
jgi:hypothetical protein